MMYLQTFEGSAVTSTERASDVTSLSAIVFISGATLQ